MCVCARVRDRWACLSKLSDLSTKPVYKNASRFSKLNVMKIDNRPNKTLSLINREFP